MFINDITKVCPCYLFADDCIIEQFGETPTLAINKTNNLLPSITTWYTNNLLKLNTKKTTVMIISNRQVHTNTLPHITIDGHNALFSPTMKYLGLIIDNSLNWNDHIASIKKKVMPLIWKLSQIRYLIDQATSRLYYTSRIRPHLEYAAATLFLTAHLQIVTHSRQCKIDVYVLLHELKVEHLPRHYAKCSISQH